MRDCPWQSGFDCCVGLKRGSIFPSAFSDFLSGLWRHRLGSLWASPELTTINGIIHFVEFVENAIDVKN